MENWQIAIGIAGLLTGGLGGAALTQFLTRRQAQQAKRRISVVARTVHYTLPTGASRLKPLRVSYGGREFDKLSLFELRVKSGDKPLASPVEIVLSHAEGTAIVDEEQSVESNAFEIEIIHDLEKRLSRLTAPPLAANEGFVVRLLLDGAPPEWRYRGLEDIKIDGPVTDERRTDESGERIKRLGMAATGAAVASLTAATSTFVVSVGDWHRNAERREPQQQRYWIFVSNPSTSPATIEVFNPDANQWVKNSIPNGKSCIEVFSGVGILQRKDVAATESTPQVFVAGTVYEVREPVMGANMEPLVSMRSLKPTDFVCR